MQQLKTLNDDDKLGKMWTELTVSYLNVISYNLPVYTEENHENPEWGESGSSQHSQLQNNKLPVMKAKFNNSKISIRSHNLQSPNWH
jgi:hypothetical protein